MHPITQTKRQFSGMILKLLAVGLALAGLSVRASELDDTIVALMAKRKIPGLSLAIIKDGVIVKAQGYGVTRLEGGAPVTADTLFQAGSVSKPVTALGALRLVEQQKLSLDANVNSALRSWHLPENEFTRDNPVTLRRLLSHTAGTTVHGFPGYAVDAAVPTLVQVLDGQPPANTKPIRVDFTPGSKWRYSGGGYVIVQQLLTDVSGRSFPDFMQETVLGPLGMNASTFAQPLPASRASLAATGYRSGGKPVPGGWHVYPEMAPAGLWTTPSDLARVLIAVQKSYAGAPGGLLKPDTARQMLTVEKGNFGLGFHLTGQEGLEQFDHNGRDDGFDTFTRAYRGAGLGAVIMINANDDSLFMIRVIDAIAKEYNWPGHVPYASPKAIVDQEPEVTKAIQAVFLATQQGKFGPTLYTPELGKFLATVIPGDATRTLQEMGALQSFTLVRRWNNGPDRAYRYHVVAANDTAIAQCIYRPDGKIVMISLQPE